MANPRQRRKQRSTTYRKNSQSVRSRKNMKKPPAIRGPKVLQEAWDRTKTVRQNYAAMGLLSSLNPKTSGGVEVDPGMLAGVRQDAATAAAGLHVTPSAPGPTAAAEEAAPGGAARGPAESRTAGLRKGQGRIVRDAEGNVVGVELGQGEEAAAAAAAPEEATRRTADTIDWEGTGRASEWVQVLAESADPSASAALIGNLDDDGESAVVRALVQIASADGGPVVRYTSGGERGYLAALVNAYGADVEGMARDRKLNRDQRTAGQLRRAIEKAGGFSRLGAASA